jgi:hypothetical protein
MSVEKAKWAGVGIMFGITCTLAGTFMSTGEYKNQVKANTVRSLSNEKGLKVMEVDVSSMKARQDADHELLVKMDRNIEELVKRTNWD